MKEYISKNWKKILFAICGLVTIINVVLIIVTPNNILKDYYDYGPKYSYDMIDIEAEGNDLVEITAEKTGTSFGAAKIIVIFSVLLIGCLILDDIMQGKEKKK